VLALSWRNGAPERGSRAAGAARLKNLLVASVGSRPIGVGRYIPRVVRAADADSLDQSYRARAPFDRRIYKYSLCACDRPADRCCSADFPRCSSGRSSAAARGEPPSLPCLLLPPIQSVAAAGALAAASSSQLARDAGTMRLAGRMTGFRRAVLPMPHGRTRRRRCEPRTEPSRSDVSRRAVLARAFVTTVSFVYEIA